MRVVLAQLACDGHSEPQRRTGGIRFTIGINVDTADEVDRLTAQMRNAGARATKDRVDAEFFTGRSAYLCDPTFIKLVRTGVADCGERFGEIVG